MTSCPALLAHRVLFTEKNAVNFVLGYGEPFKGMYLFVDL